jgi:hypothetical protein
MNNSCGRHRFARRAAGQAAVELALLLPVVLILLLAAADFGRLFYMTIGLNSAARAGAQYGSRSVVTAADIAGIEDAALTDGSNIRGISATASQCSCITPPPPEISACPQDYCAADSGATFVRVKTMATFNTLVRYPGIPSQVSLTGSAVMQVQQ